MTLFKKQLVAAAATGLLMLNIAAPVFATDTTTTTTGTSLEITGNGSGSTNKIYSNNSQTNNIEQTNNAVVTNSISSNSSTGNNVAKDNTGGDVKVLTGDAKTVTSVNNVLNSNTANVACCGAGATTVKIAGNGSDSYNKVGLDQSSENNIGQYNAAEVTNSVSAGAETGHNYAKDNTGGNVTISTGDATTRVDVSTMANANFARVGGTGAGAGAGALSAVITGNGEDSHNKIYLDLNKLNNIGQDNTAVVSNEVEADASTGHNAAKDNTGGDVLVVTGDAKSTVGIDNMVNFNWADVDCGCLQDLTAKVAGNGADSYNKIKADLENTLNLSQGGEEFGNHALLGNEVGSNSETGRNYAKDNGGVVSDPWIVTGDGTSKVDVNNTGNSNVYGGDMPADWPFSGLGAGLTLTIDLDQLAHMLTLHLV